MRSETLERYVEAVRDLQGWRRRARTKDIARKLKVKEASVTEMLRRLKKRGLVEYEPYRGAALTRKGNRLADELTRKHNTLAEFLKVLGVNEKTAEADACRIEHIVDQKTMEKLRKFLRFIEEAPEKPQWLDHYRYFVKTGKHPECERRGER
jgi:DtxR family Mn-dependent transcriptional regulator